MEVILLERIARVGQMGDVVRVRDGFARNYLLPQGKALRATEANRQRFEGQRSQLEARNLERKQEADQVGSRLGGKIFVVIRQAGETGQLYGSVTPRDLAAAMTDGGFSINRNQVGLDQPIKTIGLHKVNVALHPEVSVAISVNVARSPDEAERQARGEDLTVREGPEPIATGEAAAEEEEAQRDERFFEPTAAPAEEGQPEGEQE
jgi:large subunit ribosomal protein L9